MSNYKEERPWGAFEVIYEDRFTKVKKIFVVPEGKLSLQSHEKRSEVWTIIYGGGEMTVGDNVNEELRYWEVKKGDVVEIPVGEKHRIENTTKEPLVFIEVQWGESFEEDDITRYEDKYNRA